MNWSVLDAICDTASRRALIGIAFGPLPGFRCAFRDWVWNMGYREGLYIRNGGLA